MPVGTFPWKVRENLLLVQGCAWHADWQLTGLTSTAFDVFRHLDLHRIPRQIHLGQWENCSRPSQAIQPCQVVKLL